MSFKKIGFSLASVLVFILVFVFIKNAFFNGTIQITTNDRTAEITITKAATETAKGEGASKIIKKAKGSTSVSTSAGKYIIKAITSSSASATTVTITRGQTTNISLNLVSPTPVEPVADNTASSIVASSTQLYYLDPSTKNLFFVSNDNKITSINPALQFTNIQWVDSTYGIGQGINGNLYEIKNGQISLVNTKIPTSSAANSNYAVAPSHQLYIAFDKAVYSFNPPTGLKKVYVSTATPKLVASPSGVVALTVGVDSAGTNIHGVELAYIKTNGQVSKKQLGLYELSASPNGKMLATSDDTSSTLFDNDFNEIGIIPNANVSNMAWIDDNTFVYSVGSEVWHYLVKQNLAEKIANTPNSGAVLGLSPSDQKDYLYMAAEHGYNNPVIKRISLKNKPFSTLAGKLQDIMPIATNDYVMTSVNFTKPTVFIQPTAYASIPEYMDAARSDLTNRGIDPSSINLIFGASN